ncbi:hypothetical protein EV356DRAFT_26415 [Viridothelium virens]|uniref:Secreted protein n=1 Tax=Viridothelium virens TaxID=1048519 RepID=A0A6A6HH27_VIRVR|nr:hypothetical protein EV356DRAFT_26415 [Viridothelium virens]
MIAHFRRVLYFLLFSLAEHPVCSDQILTLHSFTASPLPRVGVIYIRYPVVHSRYFCFSFLVTRLGCGVVPGVCIQEVRLSGRRLPKALGKSSLRI